MSQKNKEAITIVWKEREHKHNKDKPWVTVKALLRINVDIDVRARTKKDESPNTDTCPLVSELSWQMLFYLFRCY